ncbi:MAG: 50S ribosomal protein L23 [Helcococcus sp.]|nr:50S ribosomal protein L23 [Helcococcus sp.]
MKSPYDIIISPVISERSMELNEERKYVFKVDKKANKSEIKAAIETIFEGVKVEKVNTMNMLGKKTRLGRIEGKKSDWKKAIITLKDDSKTIELFEEM